jgi:hypothetical protein
MEDYNEEEQMKKIKEQQEQVMRDALKVIKELKTKEYEKNPLKK